MQKRPLLLVFISVFLFYGCAGLSRWSPDVESDDAVSRKKSPGPISKDISECREFAKQKFGNELKQAPGKSLMGGGFGAGVGAILGAMLGDPGIGAAFGATGGGSIALMDEAQEADDLYKEAFIDCLRERGHMVEGY